ncbi:MAG: hypothetical protein QOF72_416, partial [Blastocatellia bacterium]|nr:hypothetical protein [Blastocatellia bacterium]
RQNSPQLAQSGHSYHRVADPVGDANNDTIDLIPR